MLVLYCIITVRIVLNILSVVLYCIVLYYNVMYLRERHNK